MPWTREDRNNVYMCTTMRHGLKMTSTQRRSRKRRMGGGWGGGGGGGTWRGVHMFSPMAFNTQVEATQSVTSKWVSTTLQQQQQQQQQQRDHIKVYYPCWHATMYYDDHSWPEVQSLMVGSAQWQTESLVWTVCYSLRIHSNTHIICK